ncbi:MAG: pyridoxamine 5'-phosphate oxidase family protein [Oscillospiraceae bacterium]|nr:pyridoxamine 5'-phosphate oxidase family protein [Oscillospiraceae bacterium]
MDTSYYLKMLVEDMHSATVATLCADGLPQTRIIDMMLYDAQGVYFLTARGKAFYDQLMQQRYVAISASKDKRAVSLRALCGNLPQEDY